MTPGVGACLRQGIGGEIDQSRRRMDLEPRRSTPPTPVADSRFQHSRVVSLAGTAAECVAVVEGGREAHRTTRRLQDRPVVCMSVGVCDPRIENEVSDENVEGRPKAVVGADGALKALKHRLDCRDCVACTRIGIEALVEFGEQRCPRTALPVRWTHVATHRPTDPLSVPGSDCRREFGHDGRDMQDLGQFVGDLLGPVLTPDEHIGPLATCRALLRQLQQLLAVRFEQPTT